MSDRIAHLTKLLAADPSDPDLPYMLALEHANAGRRDEAMTWLDKTIALSPNYSYAYYQKAKLFAQIGDAAAARAVLNEGLGKARETGDEKAQRELAELLEGID